MLLNCPLMIAELVVIPALENECLSSVVSGNCLDRVLFSCGATAHIGFRLLLFLRFLDHTQLNTHTSLQECSARHYQHSKHERPTSMPSSGLEPAIPAIERPQTHALDRTATGIGQTVLAFNP